MQWMAERRRPPQVGLVFQRKGWWQTVGLSAAAAGGPAVPGSAQTSSRAQDKGHAVQYPHSGTSCSVVHYITKG